MRHSFLASSCSLLRRHCITEVGHHVCRHDFGQDPVQEREADAYAHRLLKKAHPRLAWVLRMLRAGRRTEIRGLREDDFDASDGVR